MQDATDVDSTAWQALASLQELQARGRLAVKLGGRQLALFLHQGSVHACNNRCPHEGYPLVEGALDADGVLTCHWHNWKFDLATGANCYGGDALRVYPVRVDGDRVWVDLADPPAHAQVASVLAQLDAAMAERDVPRIARELARLARAGAPVDVAAARAILASHTRLRYGMTHAYAAAEVWLRLHDSLADAGQRLACITEALAYIAEDTLREADWPFADRAVAWDAAAFAAAVQAQDEASAVALLQGAAHAGLSWAELEPSLAAAALAHYNDFGHSLIYLVHARGLVLRLGNEVMLPLLRAWLRSLVYATREDLLPDFAAYAGALAAWPGVAGSGAAPDGAAFEGRSVRATLAATCRAAASASPLGLHAALMHAAACHLLRFDTRHAERSDNGVADNVGWLDFTHALTFGHALRQVCTRHPALWPQGLLQLAMFVGRNSAYLDRETSAEAALQTWAVADAEAFDAKCIATLIDHGHGVPIFPAHLLKTWAAVRDEIALGAAPELASTMRAAVNRLYSSRLKQRHLLRVARQALAFVAREG